MRERRDDAGGRWRGGDGFADRTRGARGRRGPGGTASMTDFTSEVRDGMRIDWDIPVRMDDGLVLRADVYRPLQAGKYHVILAYGPYGIWLHLEDVYHDQWGRIASIISDVPWVSTIKYQN